jgi:hypothetical protein
MPMPAAKVSGMMEKATSIRTFPRSFARNRRKSDRAGASGECGLLVIIIILDGAVGLSA